MATAGVAVDGVPAARMPNGGALSASLLVEASLAASGRLALLTSVIFRSVFIKFLHLFSVFDTDWLPAVPGCGYGRVR